MAISDVKSTRVGASGAIFAGPGRVKAIYIVAGGTAGSVTIKDGGASGTSVCVINTPALATETIMVNLPGAGIKCDTSIYATVSQATSVTVFYA